MLRNISMRKIPWYGHYACAIVRRLCGVNNSWVWNALMKSKEQEMFYRYKKEIDLLKTEADLSLLTIKILTNRAETERDELARRLQSSEHYLSEARGHAAAMADELATVKAELSAANAEIERLREERNRKSDNLEIDLHATRKALRSQTLDNDLLQRLRAADHAAAKGRNRDAAQIIIAAIGAEGPESVDVSARRIVERLATANAEIERLREALPDPNKLDLLARMFDVALPEDLNPEIQNTLREWAENIRAALGAGE